MDEKPKRAWWQKKRWYAAAVVCLAVAYPISLGPYVYARQRGWCRFDAVYLPIWPRSRDWRTSYIEWFANHAYHAGRGYRAGEAERRARERAEWEALGRKHGIDVSPALDRERPQTEPQPRFTLPSQQGPLLLPPVPPQQSTAPPATPLH